MRSTYDQVEMGKRLQREMLTTSMGKVLANSAGDTDILMGAFPGSDLVAYPALDWTIPIAKKSAVIIVNPLPKSVDQNEEYLGGDLESNPSARISPASNA